MYAHLCVALAEILPMLCRHSDRLTGMTDQEISTDVGLGPSWEVGGKDWVRTKWSEMRRKERGAFGVAYQTKRDLAAFLAYREEH